MSSFKQFLSHPVRWRRSKGFGVHSPFAYHFITRVLGEKKAQYYAYAEIAAFCPKARRAGFNEIFAGKDMSVPEAHMLFRVLCHFNPSEVIEIGHGHEVTNIIFSRALPKANRQTWHPGRPVTTTSAEPFVLINQFTDTEKNEIGEFIKTLCNRTDAVIFIRNIDIIDAVRHLLDELMQEGTCGMVFCDDYNAIIVNRRSLPHQIFRILL